MVKVIVFGTPKKSKESDIERLVFFEELKKLIKYFGDLYPELEIKQEEIFVFFPADMMEEGLGEEIVIFVEGFPTTKQDVRNALAQRISGMAAGYYRKSAIDCTIRAWIPDFSFPRDSCYSIQKRR